MERVDPAAIAAAEARVTAALDSQPDCPGVSDARASVVGLARGLDPDELVLGPSEALVRELRGYLARVLADARNSLAGAGIEAVAAAYRDLDYQDDLPIGSGPWKVRHIDPGSQMDLEAFDGFHRGPPATSAVQVRLLRTADAVDAVRSGAGLAAPAVRRSVIRLLVDGLDGVQGLTFAEYDESWFVLHYNVRNGALFSDKRLRKAMELCIDKDATVAAATSGWVPIQGPVPFSHWAFEPKPGASSSERRGGEEIDRGSGLGGGW